MNEGTDNLDIATKKVEGRMKKFYADVVLLEQNFVIENENVWI